MKTPLELEQKLLLMLLANSANDSQFFYDVLGQAERIDWARFRQLVLRHRVGALVYANLANITEIKPPAEIVGWLGTFSHKNAISYIKSVDTSAKLTSVLQKDGIDCVILKGCSIAADFYARPAQREMIDIDLLVDPARYEDAERLVIENGFERIFPKFTINTAQRETLYKLHNAFTFIRRGDGQQLDLHWRKVHNPILLSNMDRNWRSNVIWSQSTGLSLPVLQPAMHFVYIVVHGAKHGWVRLKWLVDLDKASRSLTPDQCAEVAQIIRSNGLSNITQASFDLAKRALGTPVPSGMPKAENPKAATMIDRLSEAMAFGEEPSKPISVGDGRYYVDRVRHSLALHEGQHYRRHALARQLASPLDVEQWTMSSDKWWYLPFLSPVLAMSRGIKKFALKPQR